MNTATTASENSTTLHTGVAYRLTAWIMSWPNTAMTRVTSATKMIPTSTETPGGSSLTDSPASTKFEAMNPRYMMTTTTTTTIAP